MSHVETYLLIFALALALLTLVPLYFVFRQIRKEAAESRKEKN